MLTEVIPLINNHRPSQEEAIQYQLQPIYRHLPHPGPAHDPNFTRQILAMRLLQLGDLGGVTVKGNLLDDNLPPYAVLSHTWEGELGDEVVLQDIRAGYYDHKPGYRKILFCGAQARRDGLEYFWVDTCCIDKKSSAELAEAINSMYRGYKNAAKCYVYLSDVSVSHEGQGSQDQAGPVSYGAVLNYTGLSYTSRSFDTGLNYTCRNYISRNLLNSESYTSPSFESLPAVPPSDSSWLDSFRRSRWFTRGWTLQELLAPSTVEFFTSNGRLVGDRQSLKHSIQSITGIPLPAFQNS